MKHESHDLYCGAHLKQGMSFEPDEVQIFSIAKDVLDRILVEAEVSDMRREPAVRAPWGAMQVSLE